MSHLTYKRIKFNQGLIGTCGIAFKNVDAANVSRGVTYRNANGYIIVAHSVNTKLLGSYFVIHFNNPCSLYKSQK